jgi:hypothetical protein
MEAHETKEARFAQKKTKEARGGRELASLDSKDLNRPGLLGVVSRRLGGSPLATRSCSIALVLSCGLSAWLQSTR